eukprot:g5571.t1
MNSIVKITHRYQRCLPMFSQALSLQVRCFGSPARKPYTGNRAKKFLNFEELQEREALAKPNPDDPIRVRAKVKNIRTSGKKMIHMARLITGMKVDDAMAQLYFIKKRRGHVFQRAIKFACSVADNEHDINQRDLRIESAVVNKANVMKRVRFHGRGKTGRRDHAHCHIAVTVVEDTPETRERAIAQDAKRLERKAERLGVSMDGDSSVKSHELDDTFRLMKEPVKFPGFRGMKKNKKYSMVSEEEIPVRLSRRMALAPAPRKGTKEQWSLDKKGTGYTWRSRFLRGARGGKHDVDVDVPLTTDVDLAALERAQKYSTWGAKSL